MASDDDSEMFPTIQLGCSWKVVMFAVHNYNQSRTQNEIDGNNPSWYALQSFVAQTILDENVNNGYLCVYSIIRSWNYFKSILYCQTG